VCLGATTTLNQVVNLHFSHALVAVAHVVAARAQELHAALYSTADAGVTHNRPTFVTLNEACGGVALFTAATFVFALVFVCRPYRIKEGIYQ
jgi:hypothetical protein